MAKLKNEKHEQFCLEYLVDLNATQAYLRVYKTTTENAARTSAAKLLANPNIMSRIDGLKKARASSVKLDAKNVLDSILEIRRICMEADEPNVNGALKANELLGKHLKLFTEKYELRGNMTLEALVDESRDPGGVDNE